MKFQRGIITVLPQLYSGGFFVHKNREPDFIGSLFCSTNLLFLLFFQASQLATEKLI